MNGPQPVAAVRRRSCVRDRPSQIIHENSDVTLVRAAEVARALDAAELLAEDKISARGKHAITIKPVDDALLAGARWRPAAS